MEITRRTTTQDVSWFIDLHKNNQLDLDPTYQRRSVWSPKDRRFFLDTIFRGFPSPAIFLNKKINEVGKTVYAVVDGKQRLETIIKFIDNQISIARDYGDTRLDGKKWRNIKSDQDLAMIFWNYVIPVEFINVIEGTNYVNEVFDRMNRNSLRLVDQELRHAKWDGWFITFVEKESEEPAWQTLEIVTTARAKRMRDVQFLSELLIVILKNSIGGFDQNEINKFYADYDNPDEIDTSFDELATKARFVDARSYLVEMEKANSAVTKYAKDFKDFYSLWAIVAMNRDRLPQANVFAQSYTSFMEVVNKFKTPEFLDDANKESFPMQYRYYLNSVGASTEPPQRQERHDALNSIIAEN
jgi:hypothetical protein